MLNPNNDYWRLICEVKFVKTKGELFEEEPCVCTSKFAIFDEDCERCRGARVIKKLLPYPPRPEIPVDLLDRLRKTFLEWKNENNS
jgi:hypothetical protein